MKTLLVLTLGALTLVGCEKEKEKAKAAAQDALGGATSRLALEYDELKILDQARKLGAAVELRDMDSLKRLCFNQGDGDYGDILNCYYNAFAIENSQGVAAARQYLADEIARTDNSAARGGAAKALNEYFVAKCSLRTKELAGIILVLALEAKYGHHGAKVGQLIAEKSGLLDAPKATTQPAKE